MPFEPIYLLYGAIFLGAFLLIEGLFFLVVDNVVAPRQVNRRMQMLSSGMTNKEVYETLLKRSARKDGENPLTRIYAWFDGIVVQSGVTVETRQIMVLMGALTIGTLVIYMVLVEMAVVPRALASPVIGIVIAVIVGLVIPLLRLSSMKKTRLSKFNEQLPDALDVMVRALQAGHPVSSALGLVTKEMGDPIGSEFGMAVDEMTYGLELREALGNMADRVDVEDFKYVVVAISVQHETGGNLAEVLHGLSSIIRARFRMFRKVRALSAEGRLSMKILTALPFVFAGFAFISRPEFYLDVIEDPLFLPIVGGGLMLELLGILIMHKLVNFRV
jgi:tight adherence protein B